MKRVLIFIGMKAVEISLIVLCAGYCPYWLGTFLSSKWPDFWNMHAWLDGFFGLCVLTLALLVAFACGMLCVRFIKANWEWAGRMARK
jgi:hypothetical protein